MNKRYLYFVLENGKVFAPYENEIESLYDMNARESWYITKSGQLAHKITYGDEIDYDDSLGKANYSHYTTDYAYLGKVKAKFHTIDELVNYLKGESTMKAIMLSIKPKWVAKILNGEKTIEVRKKFPKDYAGWVYIYCTKEKDLFKSYIRMGYFTTRSSADDMEYNGKGKVVARFWCDNVEEIKFDDKVVQERSCLTEDELFDYLFINIPYNKDMHKGYGIYITKLEIFDKPKELSEFRKLNTPTYEQTKPFAEMFGEPYSKEEYLRQCKMFGYLIKKAPQSWCYVEEEE